MPPDTPIFIKTYDWSLWLFKKTAHFPKRFRHSLTQRIERDTLDLERILTEANVARGRIRARHLDRADAVLDCLRANVRRSFDLQCMPGRSYEYAAKALNEIGSLLGGWKRVAARRAP